MATKKRTTAKLVAETTNLPALPQQLDALLTSDLQINKDDVLSIAVSEAERLMQAQVSHYKRQVKELQASIETDEKQLKVICQKHAEATYRTAMNTVVRGLTGIGYGGLKVHIGHTTPATADAQPKRYAVQLNVAHGTTESESGRNLLSQTVYTDIPEDAAALLDAIRATQKEKEVAVNEGVVWKQKLAGIGTLEREYRARLAKLALGKTEEGRALLNDFMTSVEQSVLLLAN